MIIFKKRKGKDDDAPKALDVGFLHMIAKLQLHGMGIQIVLLFQVGLVVFAHIVLNQGNGHNERDIALAIEIDCLQQFLFFITR